MKEISEEASINETHPSDVVNHLEQIAKTGNLQDAVDYLHVCQHKIVKKEAAMVTKIAYDILHARLNDSVRPLTVEDLRLASILVKKSQRIIHKSGLHSAIFEKQITDIMNEMAEKALTLAIKKECRMRINNVSPSEIDVATREVSEAEAYLDAARLSSHANMNYKITNMARAMQLFKKIHLEKAINDADLVKTSNLSLRVIK